MNIREYMERQYPINVETFEGRDEQYCHKFYILTIPALPGCAAAGRSYNEAKQRLLECKEKWIMRALEQGEMIPEIVTRDSKPRLWRIYRLVCVLIQSWFLLCWERIICEYFETWTSALYSFLDWCVHRWKESRPVFAARIGTVLRDWGWWDENTCA